MVLHREQMLVLQKYWFYAKNIFNEIIPLQKYWLYTEKIYNEIATIFRRTILHKYWQNVNTPILGIFHANINNTNPDIVAILDNI